MTALVEMRKQALEEEAAGGQDAGDAAEEQAVFEDAERRAMDAFDQAGATWDAPELDFQTFFTAFREDEAFIQKVARAADLPVNLLKRMHDGQLQQFFQELDT